MKILVLGGAGFLGSHLVDELVKKHDVVVYDCLEQQVHNGTPPKYLNPKAKYLPLDIRDTDRLKNVIMDGVDVIFHEASMVGVAQSMYQMVKYSDVNVMGTVGLLDILANEEHDVRKLILTASNTSYGEGEYTCPSCGDRVYPKLRTEEQLKRKEWEHKCDYCGKELYPVGTSEDKPLNPTSVYAITKRDQEDMCLTVGRAYGIPTVSLRCFSIYGERQSLSNPYTGVCAVFSSMIKNNNPPMIFEDGLQTRDFVSVRDVVRANLMAMENSRMDYDMFNVGSGEPTPIIGVAQVLTKLYGSDLVPVVTNQYRKGDYRHCYADIKKIKKMGFEPKVSFEDGMKELVRWGMGEDAKDGSGHAYQELVENGLVEK